MKKKAGGEQIGTWTIQTRINTSRNFLELNSEGVSIDTSCLISEQERKCQANMGDITPDTIAPLIIQFPDFLTTET